MAQRPDVIVSGGDYVSFGDRAFVDPVAELLAPLQAPHGVFAILGNHDDERDVPEALTKRSVTVLNDTRTRLAIRGESLELAGVRFWTRKPDDIARVLTRRDRYNALARARSATADGGSGAERARRPVRPHTRRSGRAAGPRHSHPTAFPCVAGPGSEERHLDLRESGGRDGLRTGQDQLPPGSGHPHPGASSASLTTRRPSTRHPPDRTSLTASG